MLPFKIIPNKRVYFDTLVYEAHEMSNHVENHMMNDLSTPINLKQLPPSARHRIFAETSLIFSDSLVFRMFIFWACVRRASQSLTFLFQLPRIFMTAASRNRNRTQPGTKLGFGQRIVPPK